MGTKYQKWLDVAEFGRRTGDVGTVVERHIVPGVTEDGHSMVLRYDGQHRRRGHSPATTLVCETPDCTIPFRD